MGGNLIDHGAARAIVEGRHGDPFSVLGLHKREGAWVVTAFVPGAERVEVLAGKAGKPVAAAEVSGCAGLFCAALPRNCERSSPKSRISTRHVGTAPAAWLASVLSIL